MKRRQQHRLLAAASAAALLSSACCAVDASSSSSSSVAAVRAAAASSTPSAGSGGGLGLPGRRRARFSPRNPLLLEDGASVSTLERLRGGSTPGDDDAAKEELDATLIDGAPAGSEDGKE